MPFDTAAGTFLVPGPAGASAYEAWRGLGNTGSVSDFLATLVGEPGPASTEPGPEGRPGRDGAGSITSRTASGFIAPWTAVIADGPTNCLPADPFNETHRGRVIGISALGGAAGTQVTIQNAGDLAGPPRGFAAEAVLFVGAGGSVAPSAPAGATWRQPVATVVSDGHVVVSLGEASLMFDDATAVLAEGGFSTPCSLDGANDADNVLGYVTPAANARALAGKLGLTAFIKAALGYTVPRATKSILDWLADLMVEGSDLRSLGFVGDGASHPLSGRFETLAEAKAVFPRATALTEEIDGHAIQRRIDLAVAGDYGACIVLPRGSVALTSFQIDSTETKACHVSSPGPATIRCVGSALGCWLHGSGLVRARGAFTWRGVDLDTSSSAETTLLTTFFGIAGVGRGQCLTLQKARFNNGTRGWLLGDMPRGLTVDDLQVFGPDFQMQAGAGIEVVVSEACTYGSFAYSWKDVIVANYTWAWDFTCAQALEGLLFSGCHGYNGWGFCRLRNNRAGFYYSLLWEFNGCDHEGLGFALDFYRARGLRVRGGFWIGTANNTNRPLPAGIVTTGGEIRHVNLRDVNDFILDGMMLSAGGPSDGSTRTNFVLVHTDAACYCGEIVGTSVVSDHATATCAFRLSGSKRGTIVERRTKLLNWWGAPPVVLYAGTGEQPYQISASDVAANRGTVSDEGYFQFSGRWSGRTDAQGRITIPLPLRAGGTLPFFFEVPNVFPVSSNALGPAPKLSYIGAIGSTFTLVASNAAGDPAPNVDLEVIWKAEGF